MKISKSAIYSNLEKCSYTLLSRIYMLVSNNSKTRVRSKFIVASVLPSFQCIGPYYFYQRIKKTIQHTAKSKLVKYRTFYHLKKCKET